VLQGHHLLPPPRVQGADDREDSRGRTQEALEIALERHKAVDVDFLLDCEATEPFALARGLFGRCVSRTITAAPTPMGSGPGAPDPFMSRTAATCDVIWRTCSTGLSRTRGGASLLPTKVST
jgi:hypothetical protein